MGVEQVLLVWWKNGGRSMREMKQIHGHAITMGLSRFSFISSKLLALCGRTDIRYAQTLFSHIPHPTIFDYNTIISISISSGSSLFIQMLNHSLRPNSTTFTFLLSKSFPSLPFLQQLHSHILRLSYSSDVYVVTSLISAYSNHASTSSARRVFDDCPHKNVVCWTSLLTGYCNNGLLNQARELFHAIPHPNHVSYSAMLSGYVNNGRFRDAIKLFRQLINNNNKFKPGNSVLVSVLRACAAVGAFEEGKLIHSYVEVEDDYQVEMGTALIDFYSKCGCVEGAKRVFDRMKSKDVGAWSAMIMGLAINGEKKEAIEVFEEMERVGPRPNGITFIGVLTACNDKDMCGRAVELFRYMSEKYGIVAWMEHYGCVVNVLSRSGRIQEALTFIKTMSVEPDGVIWGSLMHACFLHGYFHLGYNIGKYLIHLEPNHTGRYVLFSNVCATTASWDAVFETRNLIKRIPLPPVSASSFIETIEG